MNKAAALLLAFILAAGPLSAQAQPRLFGLFIGIGDYLHSRDTPRGTLDDLKGGPNDVAAIKGALGPRVEFATTTTLVDAAATRDAIIASYLDLVRVASPGDTIVFYYAGHGARVMDTTGQQLSGFSSTLVPYDARNPAAPSGEFGDITDNELRDLIAMASGRGINVVTIFDSCNAGTITRSPWLDDDTIKLRGAPDVAVAAVPVSQIDRQALPATRSVGTSPGAVVHLAASPDGKSSIERLENGTWRGDFTEALIRSLNELPANASYRDLMALTKVKLQDHLRNSDNPRAMTDIRAEGDLDQVFLGEWSPVRVVRGTRGEDGAWQLGAGSIAGMATGSQFAGYASAAAAREEAAAPLTTAEITSLTAFDATLVLDGAAADLPAEMFWRETRRGAGNRPLRVAINGGAPPTRDAVAAQLEGLAYTAAGDGNPDIVLDLTQEGSVRMIAAQENREIAQVPTSDSAALTGNLRQLASYHSLLNLVGSGEMLAVDYEIASEDCYGTPGPELVHDEGEPVFIDGDDARNRFTLLLRNNSGQPLYPHIINLTAQYKIQLAAVRGYEADDDYLAPGVCWNWPVTVSGKGRDHLIVVLADRPLPGLEMLNAGALAGATRSVTEDPLAALLLDAASGQATRSAASAGQWSVYSVSYLVEENPE